MSISFSSSKSGVIPFLVLTRIRVEHRTGLINIATNNDEERVIISVFGKNLMNSPAIPGMKIKGKKAAMVVMVEVVTGTAISFTPIIAASTRFFPACR